MPTDNSEKGRALERAVRFIQETILKSDPKLAGIEFSVEANKVVTVSGVHHEIDVLVKTLPNSLYESTWIFECKNRKKPSSKDDVIVLAAKVKAIQANRGFLVARHFSKDAKAQVKTDPRLRLVSCTDEFESPLNSLEAVHTAHELFSLKVYFRERGVPPAEHPMALDWRTQVCRLNNAPVDFRLFLFKQADEIALEDRKANSVQYRYEGTHWRERSQRIDFVNEEFKLGKADVEYMMLELRFMVVVRRQKLRSQFELKGQGRAFHFDPIDDFIPGKRLEIDVVQLF